MSLSWKHLEGGGGIRGVFKDSSGKILVQFGKELVVDSTVHVELLALRQGLLVAVASWWALSHSFLFEFDSQ